MRDSQDYLSIHPTLVSRLPHLITYLSQDPILLNILKWAYQCLHFVCGDFLSLLNRVGCVGAWVTWVQLLRGVRESTFYVGHNFYMDCVSQNVLRGSLHGSKIFPWLIFLGVVLKKILIDAFTITSYSSWLNPHNRC